MNFKKSIQMKSVIFLSFLLIAGIMPHALIAQSYMNNIPSAHNCEMKIILVQNNCITGSEEIVIEKHDAGDLENKKVTETNQVNRESKPGILDVLQKESEETIVYPLVQLAHLIQNKIQQLDKKNMVSSCAAGKEGEAGGSTSR